MYVSSSTSITSPIPVIFFIAAILVCVKWYLVVVLTHVNQLNFIVYQLRKTGFKNAL
jgi:hypothetical protein